MKSWFTVIYLMTYKNQITSFIKNTNYLVYEENRLTDDDINYKKQKAVECNVAFTFNGTTFNGYYKSSLRGSEDQAFEGRQLISPDETPLLILPTNFNY